MKVLDIITEVKRQRRKSKPAPRTTTPAPKVRPFGIRPERLEQLKNIRAFLSGVDKWILRSTFFGNHVKTVKAMYYVGKISASALGLIRWLGAIEIYQEYEEVMAKLKACHELKENDVGYDELYLTDEEYAYAVKIWQAAQVAALVTSETFNLIIGMIIKWMGRAQWIARLGAGAAGAVTLGFGTIAIWGLTTLGMQYVQQAVQSPAGRRLIAQFIIWLMTPDDEKGPIDHWGQGLAAALKGIPEDQQRELWKPPPGQVPGDRDPDGKLLVLGKNLTDPALAARIKEVEKKVAAAESENNKNHWTAVLEKLKAEQTRRNTKSSTQSVPGGDDQQSITNNPNMPQRNFDQQAQDIQKKLSNLPSD